MNKRIQIGLILVITLVLLLGLTIPSLAKNPVPFGITYEYTHINLNNHKAKGTFTITTNQIVSGVAKMEWTPLRSDNLGAHKGTMTFTNVVENLDLIGSFTIQFAIPKKSTSGGCRYGTFQILPEETTGVYIGWQGNGTITMCSEEGTDNIVGSLEGTAHR